MVNQKPAGCSSAANACPACRWGNTEAAGFMVARCRTASAPDDRLPQDSQEEDVVMTPGLDGCPLPRGQ